jgi:hypothetical protein
LSFKKPHTHTYSDGDVTANVTNRLPFQRLIDVILTSGVDGILSPKYFEKIEIKKHNEI